MRINSTVKQTKKFWKQDMKTKKWKLNIINKKYKSSHHQRSCYASYGGLLKTIT